MFCWGVLVGSSHHISSWRSHKTSICFQQDLGGYEAIFTWLVFGTNPFEKYESKWVHLPQIGVNIKNIWNHHLVTLVHLYLDFHLDLLGRLYRETLVLWRLNCWLMEQLILFSPRFLLLEEQKFIKQKIWFYFVENFERGVAAPIRKLDGACCGSHLSWLIFGGGGPFGATCQENVDPKSVVADHNSGWIYVYIYIIIFQQAQIFQIMPSCGLVHQ